MRTLSFAQVLRAALHAGRLLGRYPFRWSAIALLFLLCVEGVMFIPYAGFLIKAAVSGILVTQVMVLYSAGDTRPPPRVLDLWRGFQLPLPTQLLLALTGLFPLCAGLLFLALLGEWDVARSIFFGHVVVAPRMDADLFFVFKLVVYVTGIPLVFVSAAVALAHLTWANAVRAGFSAARRNLPALAVTLALSLAFELVMKILPTVAPPVGAILSLLALLAFLTWYFAFEYALSARVFSKET